MAIGTFGDLAYRLRNTSYYYGYPIHICRTILRVLQGKVSISIRKMHGDVLSQASYGFRELFYTGCNKYIPEGTTVHTFSL